MIRAHDCSFAYPGGERILRDITFSLGQGGLFLVAGINGSGKSTLLQLLAGLLSPSSGSVEVAAMRLPGEERGVRAMAALCLQDPDLQILGATPREDLLLCLPRKADAAPALGMAARFGLEHCLDTPVHTLSHGQKRKLGLATALLTQQQRSGKRPALLLLDEPLSGLDYPAVKELRAILLDNKARGVTQLVASHDLEPLADLTDAPADRLGLMRSGSMPHVGAPLEVLVHARACGVRPPCGWSPGAPVPAWE